MCQKILLLLSIILLLQRSITTNEIIADDEQSSTTTISTPPNINLSTFVKKELAELSDEALTITRDILKDVIAFLTEVTCSYPLIEQGISVFTKYLDETENLSNELSIYDKVWYLLQWNAIKQTYYYAVKEQRNAGEMLLYATFRKNQIEEKLQAFQVRLADFFSRYEIVADYYWSSMSQEEKALKLRLCYYWDFKNRKAKNELLAVPAIVYNIYHKEW